MEKKLTISDIAKLAGVAKSTVSRYLNGGSVGKETSRKIQRVIEQNNYQPNVFARLNARESRIIGLIVPGFKSFTTPKLTEIIVAYLKEKGYTPLIMHTNNNISEELQSIERLTAMNVAGILFEATEVTTIHREAMNNAGVPIVVMGQRFEDGVSVINDDYHAGYALGQHVGQRGVQRVVCLWVGTFDHAVGQERRRGVLDALAACHVPDVRVEETTFLFDDALAAAERLLNTAPLPDAILCATDRIAGAVYKAMRAKGLRIPDDISVTGFGDYETSELLTPPMTTVRFDLKTRGESSAETLLQMIQDKPVSRLQVNGYQLMPRGSVRQP